MAYSLHIVRSADSPITLEEWEALIESDPRLSKSESKRITNPKTGEVIAISSPGGADFSHEGVELHLRFRRGSVSTDGPTDGQILAMMTLASALRARVEGDEGELY